MKFSDMTHGRIATIFSEVKLFARINVCKIRKENMRGPGPQSAGAFNILDPNLDPKGFWRSLAQFSSDFDKIYNGDTIMNFVIFSKVKFFAWSTVQEEICGESRVRSHRDFAMIK